MGEPERKSFTAVNYSESKHKEGRKDVALKSFTVMGIEKSQQQQQQLSSH